MNLETARLALLDDLHEMFARNGSRADAEQRVREYEASAPALIPAFRAEGISESYLVDMGVAGATLDAGNDARIQNALEKYWPKPRTDSPSWREIVRTQK